MNQIRKKYITFAAAVLALALLYKYSGVILDTLGTIRSITAPLLGGCAIAYILNIVVNRIEKLPFFQKEGTLLYRIRRPISITASLGIVAALIVLVILIVIPQLADAVRVLANEIPSVFSQLSSWISRSAGDWPQLDKLLDSLNLNWSQLFQRIATHLTNGLSNLFSSTMFLIGSISSLIINLVVAVIFSLYILNGREKLFRQFQTVAKTYLKETWYSRVALVLSTAHDTFTKFIIGQCTEALIIGVLCFLGMSVLGFPYASMIGTLIGATALLPIVGAYLGAFIGAFMIFTVNPLQAAGFLVFIIILQQLEGNLIYPRVVGASVGLPGIWVLAAVTIGGGLGGIAGMLAAVPLTATGYRLLKRDVQRRNQPLSKPEASPEA